MQENWIEIYEFEDYKLDTSIWIEEILKEKNIAYKTKIEEYWEGVRIPKYKKRLKIYIQKEDKDIVIKYIEKYNNPKSIVDENIEELKSNDEKESTKEIKKYNKIRKVFFIFWMLFIFLVVVLAIIGSVITN